MKVECIFRGVIERDVDFLLLEEFLASKNFCSLFLNKVNIDNAELETVCHSKFHKGSGESDIIAIFSVGRKKHALLIEDKIDAKAMPYQSSRYFERAQDDIERGLYDDFDVFIVAPQEYLSKDAEAQKYPNRVSYEEIEDFFEKQKDQRYNFKLEIIQRALHKKEDKQRQPSNKKVDAFWARYLVLLKNSYPDIQVSNADCKHGDNSHWVYFVTGYPDIKFVHKAKQGSVDVEYHNYESEQGQVLLRKAIADLPDGIDKSKIEVSSTDKHGIITIKCPPLEFECKKSTLMSQVDNIRVCLKIVNKMFVVLQNLKISQL